MTKFRDHDFMQKKNEGKKRGGISKFYSKSKQPTKEQREKLILLWNWETWKTYIGS